MYISTLLKVIKAMGGELEIKATFPDGEVRINQFKDTDIHRQYRVPGRIRDTRARDLLRLKKHLENI